MVWQPIIRAPFECDLAVIDAEVPSEWSRRLTVGIAEMTRQAGLFGIPAVRVRSRLLTNQIAWTYAKAEASQQRLQHTGCRQILHRQLHTRVD